MKSPKRNLLSRKICNLLTSFFSQQPFAYMIEKLYGCNMMPAFIQSPQSYTGECNLSVITNTNTRSLHYYSPSSITLN